LTQAFTTGSGFPTANAADPSPAPGRDLGILRIDFNFALFAKADFEIDDTAKTCVPVDVKFYNRSPRVGTSFQWNFGDPASGASNTDTAFSPKHTYAVAGTYQVVLVASKPSSCNLTDTFRLSVVIHALPKIFLGNDTCLCFSEQFKLDAGVVGGTYKWSSGSTEQTYKPDSSGTYSVVVTDPFGCVGADTIQITIQRCLTDSFNVLSPNGDGANDTWGVNGRDLEDYHVAVVNRWGSAVFTSDDSKLRWNGKVNNTGPLVSPGTYYYMVKGTTCKGQKKSRKGYVFVNYEN